MVEYESCQCHWYFEVSISCVFCGILKYMHQFDLLWWIIYQHFYKPVHKCCFNYCYYIFFVLLNQKLNTYLIRKANVTLVHTGCRIIRCIVFCLALSGPVEVPVRHEEVCQLITHGHHWRSIWHCTFFHGSMERKSWLMSSKLFWCFVYLDMQPSHWSYQGNC